MDGVIIRRLGAGDAGGLEAFLRAHIETSMFMLSNARAAGFEDEGRRLEATYVGALIGDRVVAAAALAWNGMMMVQAPQGHLGAVAREAWRLSGRALTGISGAGEQVAGVRQELGLEARPTRIAGEELLFALDLSALVMPEALSSGRGRVRRAEVADLEALSRWRVAYQVETLGEREVPAVRSSAREGVEAGIARGQLWVLEHEGEVVAMSAFNAALPECVQIGGVYTPPGLRGRGFGRAVVAGSLVEASGEGVTRSVLFTGRENVAAQAAYRALGYEERGVFGLVLFEEEVWV